MPFETEVPIPDWQLTPEEEMFGDQPLDPNAMVPMVDENGMPLYPAPYDPNVPMQQPQQQPMIRPDGTGDPTQQDCVDEATNTTSYLLVLERNGLMKHHTVGTPFSKENLLRGVAGWPHWTAVLKENASGQKWAVDSWIYANGENPAVVETEKWYIASLDELPKATR